MRNVFRNRVPAISAVVIAAAVMVGLGGSAAVGHGSFHGWADSHRIKDDSIRSKDVRNDNLGLRDFNQSTKDRINAQAQSLWFDGEDATVVLPAATGGRTEVGSLDLGAGTYEVTAHATVSGGPDDNLLCWLDDDGDPANGEELAAANARSARESFTLTAFATGQIVLECRANAGGTATDLAITAARVAPPVVSTP